MDRETRSKWIIWGSIITIISYFLPWINIHMGRFSMSENGATFQEVMWPILACGVGLLIMGVATYNNAEGFAAIVQRLLHIGQSLSLLYTFFDTVSSGFMTRFFQNAVYRGGGGYYLASTTHVDLSYGFLLLVVGIVIGGIGVYAKAE